MIFGRFCIWAVTFLHDNLMFNDSDGNFFGRLLFGDRVNMEKKNIWANADARWLREYVRVWDATWFWAAHAVLSSDKTLKCRL